MKYALQQLPDGKKLYSYHAVFGTPQDLPTQDFSVGNPVEIKNQDINYPSDFCASYAAAEVSEDQELVPLCPEYTFAAAKAIVAEKTNNPNAWQDFGLNLADICDAACQVGFLERQFDPFHCDTDQRPDRNTLAQFTNWPEDLKMLAWDHAKASYFAVDGPHDFFDNIRAVMYKNLAESRSILCGTIWHGAWNSSSDGFISSYDSKDAVGGHALKFFGQMRAHGEMWLIAQLSDGSNVGDHGLYYFNRKTVNDLFAPYGAFTFKDLPHDKASLYNYYQWNVKMTILQKMQRILKIMLQEILNLKK